MVGSSAQLHSLCKFPHNNEVHEIHKDTCLLRISLEEKNISPKCMFVYQGMFSILVVLGEHMGPMNLSHRSVI